MQKSILIYTFNAAERKSMSAPFLRIPNGGFITTVSTKPKEKIETLRRRNDSRAERKCQVNTPVEHSRGVQGVHQIDYKQT
jgi:hypothetical protein